MNFNFHFHLTVRIFLLTGKWHLLIVELHEGAELGIWNILSWLEIPWQVNPFFFFCPVVQGVFFSSWCCWSWLILQRSKYGGVWASFTVHFFEELSCPIDWQCCLSLWFGLNIALWESEEFRPPGNVNLGSLASGCSLHSCLGTWCSFSKPFAFTQT